MEICDSNSQAPVANTSLMPQFSVGITSVFNTYMNHAVSDLNRTERATSKLESNISNTRDSVSSDIQTPR